MNITKIAFLFCTLLWGLGVQAQTDSVNVAVPEANVDSKTETDKKEKSEKKTKKEKKAKSEKKVKSEVKSEIKEEPTKVKEEKSDSDTSKAVPLMYNLGIGLFNYRGDVGQLKDLGTTESFQPAYNVGAEYLVHSSFGLGLDIGYGNLVKNEKNGNNNDNFKSTLLSAGLSGTFHFANGFMLAENYPVDPFISIGVNFISFTPKTDLLDANGNQYFYWQDGTVRTVDQPETIVGDEAETRRDYVYETDLEADGESTTAIGFPVSAGFNFFVTPYLKFKLQQTVSFTNTDFLDGHLGGQRNDVYMYSNIGVSFNPSLIEPRDKKSKEYDEIDFVALLKADSDADGVLDIDDKCNDTGEGIEVDRHGCPLDKDEDGIPDHLDQEVNTDKEVAQIDSSGVGIADSLVAKAAADTVVTLREELCQFYPSMCQGDESDIIFQLLNSGKADKSLISSKVESSKKPIEDIVKLCDLDGNGKVSSKEIYQSIDNYFDGKVDLVLGDIHKLIDYYFEQ